MKTLLVVIAVLAGVVALSASVVVATSNQAAEVRIAARRLADGRVEVALQQKELDGSWGDRVQPTRRFVPPGAREGRWLTSSPVEVALPAPAPDSLPDLSGPPVADGPPSWRTLRHVIARDKLWCGVKQTQPLFGFREADGTVTGFDTEFCKAIAAAVLGDPRKVEYFNASDPSARFELLTDGWIDVLIRTTTVTAYRDRDLGIDYAHPIFYTGQGFIVHKDSDYESTADMDMARICIGGWGLPQKSLASHFTDIGLAYASADLGHDSAVEEFFAGGSCDVLTWDASALAALLAVRDDADEYKILPQLISKEPLAPVVRENDSEWKDVVNWVVQGLIAAEEMGITQANVANMAANPPNTEIARLLGVPYGGSSVSALGFDVIGAQFIQRAIAAVGNYGEIYERTLGDYIPRACTLNALAIGDSVDCPPGLGGVMYALPYR